VRSRTAAGPFALLLGGLVVPGCSDSPAPLGKGNHLVYDLDATMAPAQNAYEDSSTDSPYSPVGSEYTIPNGYAPAAICQRCACSGASYCFGGATGHTTFSGDCDGGAGAGLEIGCQPLPPACANEPDCVCLIRELSQKMPCYPVCGEGNGFVVYCPVP
jgi:hypothetical protein